MYLCFSHHTSCCSLSAQALDAAYAIPTHSARPTQQQPTRLPRAHHVMQSHNSVLERRHHCLSSHSQSHAGGAMPHECVPLCVAACAGSLPEADCSAIVAGHQAAASDTGSHVLFRALATCLGRDGSLAVEQQTAATWLRSFFVLHCSWVPRQACCNVSRMQHPTPHTREKGEASPAGHVVCEIAALSLPRRS